VEVIHALQDLQVAHLVLQDRTLPDLHAVRALQEVIVVQVHPGVHAVRVLQEVLVVQVLQAEEGSDEGEEIRIENEEFVDKNGKNQKT
jgi:hypothetical protein